MERDRIRYAVQLEMLERNSALGDREAMELLRSEFTLAQNAAHFDALAADDIDLDVLSRSTPQEGVTRYELALHLAERRPQVSDEQVTALLRRAFTNALNASYFLRVCTDDHVMVRLLGRAPVVADVPLRRAA